MSQAAFDVIRKVIQPVASRQLPPVLLERLETHRANLQNLAVSLIESGLSPEETRVIISKALESFEAQLQRTIATMGEMDNA